MDEFLKEVKKMTIDDILLAFEQPNLYTQEELKILSQELELKKADVFSYKDLIDYNFRENEHPNNYEKTIEADISNYTSPIDENKKRNISSIWLGIILLIIAVVLGTVWSASLPYFNAERKANSFDTLGIYKIMNTEGVKLVLSTAEKYLTDKDINLIKSILANKIQLLYSPYYEIIDEHTEDGIQFIIKIANVTDAEEISQKLIQKSELKFVEPTIIENEGYISYVPDLNKVIMTNNDIIEAFHLYGNVSDDIVSKETYYIQLKITDEASQEFADATERNIGQPIFIMIDDEILSAPTVQSRIDTSTPIITGDFYLKEAKELAGLISLEVLPVELNVEHLEYTTDISK